MTPVFHALVTVAQVGKQLLDPSGIDVSHVDAAMRPEIGQESVRPTVQVVTGEHCLAGLDQAEDHVEAGHACGQSEGLVGAVQPGEMGFCDVSNSPNR
jgi:hypothetical protein